MKTLLFCTAYIPGNVNRYIDWVNYYSELYPDFDLLLVHDGPLDPELKQEILEINPKIIVTFGNQVSSILLGEKIKVSDCRKKDFDLNLSNKNFKVFPVYYPIGQGMRNIKKVIEDLKWVIKNN